MGSFFFFLKMRVAALESRDAQLAQRRQVELVVQERAGALAATD